MPRTSTKPKRHGKGATLRLQRNVFIVTFRHPQRRDPQTGYGKVVRASLKTGDVTIARHHVEALNRIIRNPAYWEHLPTDTPERVRAIWFGGRLDVSVEGPGLDKPVKVAALSGQGMDFIGPSMKDFVKEACSKPPSHFHRQPSQKGAAPSMVAELRKATETFLETARFDYTDKQKAEAVAAAYAKLEDHLHFVDTTNNALNERIKILDAQNDDLQRRNQLLQIRLSQHEKRKLKDAQVGTLRDEFARWVVELDKSKFTRCWKLAKKGFLRRFVQDMGEEKGADEISESDVAAYVLSLTGVAGQRISEQTRKRMKEVACNFMSFATRGNFNTRQVPAVKRKEILREAKAIVWLTKEEVERLISKIPTNGKEGMYWQDMARIQVAMGWRPSELLILQTALANEKVMTLEPVREVTTGEVIGKTGGRAVKVPNAAKAAVRRRIQAGHALLFPKLTRQGLKKRGGVLSEAWIDTTFYVEYRAILRAAARKARIDKPIDSRTFRRTFGSLQLRAGRLPHEVAELMGDKPETVKRHYARILAHEIDTEV